ncbi:MAG: DHH family phosphoesterase [Fimbriimonas sp.]
MTIDPGIAQQFLNEVRSASSVLIGTHLNPDGDALGSALAVSFFLSGLGVQNEVLCHHPAPKNLEFLPSVRKVHRVPKGDKHDLAIMVDLESMERLGDCEPYIRECPRLIVIDHHVPHEAPGDLRIVETSAPATSAILTKLFQQLDVNFTSDIATCLLTGIVTDTGSFRFRNTTPESLSLAGFLLEHGADITQVSEEIFQNKPLASVKLLGHVLDGMRLDADESLAWGIVTLEDFEHAQAKDEDTEGFVNEMLAISTVKIAAIFRQTKPYKVRCSLRSRGNLDVAEIARAFGGGGHKNAAGCTFDTTLEEAEQEVVARMKACLASS